MNNGVSDGTNKGVIISDTTINNKTHSSCWNSTGVWGDRTCEKLAELAHCHHCKVYATAGAQLLNRSLSSAYQSEQTKQISQSLLGTQERSEQLELSVLIFRLGKEWLALPARLCQQILSPLPFHTLPHRSNRTLLGIVNVRGQILLKVSLLEVLGLDLVQKSVVERPAALVENKVYPRMIVLEKAGENGADVWAFDADELHGVHSLNHHQLERPAGNVSAVETCTQYVFSWHEQRVSVLDDDRLFDALRRRSL